MILIALLIIILALLFLASVSHQSEKRQKMQELETNISEVEKMFYEKKVELKDPDCDAGLMFRDYLCMNCANENRVDPYYCPSYPSRCNNCGERDWKLVRVGVYRDKQGGDPEVTQVIKE